MDSLAEHAAFQWIRGEAPGKSKLRLINPKDWSCQARVVVNRAHGFRSVSTLDHEDGILGPAEAGVAFPMTLCMWISH